MKLATIHLLLITALAYGTFATSMSAQTCETPRWTQGPGPIPGGGYYEYIANGQPTSANCWNLTGNVQVVQVNDCGYFHDSDYAFNLHYGARVSQEFIVPINNTQTHWNLSYLLTMQDPNNDAWWNRLKVTVYDATAGKILASETYRGDNPDISCSPRKLTFPGDLSQHRLQVIFSDGSAYSNTVFHVRGISLLQY